MDVLEKKTKERCIREKNKLPKLDLGSHNEGYKKDKSLCIDDKNALRMSHHVQEGHLFSNNCHYKPIIIW